MYLCVKPFIVMSLLAILRMTLVSSQELNQMEQTTEPTEPSNVEMSSASQMESSSESTAEVMSEEKTEMISILFEEVEPKNETSSLPFDVKSSLDSEEVITSEYKGFDVEKSESQFSCYGRSFGQYADVAKECKVFHLCYPFFNSTTDELLYQRITFLCDEDSVFDQKRFICVDNSTVEHKCSESEALYQMTNQEYLIRVFSQSVSPIETVKGHSESPPKTSSSPGWFNWLYPN